MSIDEEVGPESVDIGVKRLYRKKSESQKQSQPADDGSASAKIRLNKLSEKDVADAKMASVFGGSSTKVPLRVNPLYEKNGTVEIPANDVRRNRKGSETMSVTRQMPNGHSGKTSQNIPINTTRSPPEIGNSPKIAYGDNFRLKGNSNGNRRDSAETNSGADQQVTDLGRVLPARIQKNTLPRSYLPPTISSTGPFVNPGPPVRAAPSPPTVVTKVEVEEVMRRARIRRCWRCVLFVILGTLFFALILIVVLVFTIR